MRKFYETVYTLRVLSEEPIPDGMPLEDVLEEANTGAYVAKDELVQHERTEAQMRDLLFEFGSDPGFFQIAAEP